MGLRHLFTALKSDPLSYDRPPIEWVKWLKHNSYSQLPAGAKLVSMPTSERRMSVFPFFNLFSMASSAQDKNLEKGEVPSASLAALSHESSKFVIKTQDGRFFERHTDGAWGGAGLNGFKSRYLDNVIANAMQRGLREQLSSSDIAQHLMSPQGRAMRMNLGSNISPRPPAEFALGGDYKTSADYEGSDLKFAAFLQRRGYGPFWYDTGHDDSHVPELRDQSPDTELT